MITELESTLRACGAEGYTPPVCLLETLERFREYYALKGYSPITISQYERHLISFFHYLEIDAKVTRIQDVTSKILDDYSNRIFTLKRLRDQKPLSAMTKAQRLSAVKTLFKFLVRKKEILYNPASEMDVPKTRKGSLKDAFTEDEVCLILNKANKNTPLEIRNRAIMELLYSTGIRNSELRDLRIKDVDFRNNEVFIRSAKGRFGKKQRVIPAGKIALSYVHGYLTDARPVLSTKDPDDHLFLSANGKGLRIEVPRDIVRHYAKECGIHSRANAHKMRHTCATHLVKKGADIRHIQALLGHADLNTTAIYTKIDITDLKEIHRRTHPRENYPWKS